MNSALKVAFAAAAVGGVVAAGVDVAPRDGGGSGRVSAVLSSPSTAPSPESSPAATRLTVAGTELTGPLGLTVDLPQGWELLQNVGARLEVDGSVAPGGTVFFVSLVDNTFADPCLHTQQFPKIGSTVEARAAALGEIPGTTATAPVQTTIAGRDAVYLEYDDPASLPCSPDEFYLWQDSPDGDWWVFEPDQVIRVWMVDVDGQGVAIANRYWSGTSDDVKAQALDVLNTIRFDAPPAQPSPAPAAS